MDSFALDFGEGLLAGFGGVVEDEGEAEAAFGVGVKRRGINAEEAGLRVGQFQLETQALAPALGIHSGQGLPVELREEAADMFAFDLVRRPVEQGGHRLVEIKDAPAFIEDQYSILNDIEQVLQKSPFPLQPHDDRLHALGVEPLNATEDLVEETGFGGRQATVKSDELRVENVVQNTNATCLYADVNVIISVPKRHSILAGSRDCARPMNRVGTAGKSGVAGRQSRRMGQHRIHQIRSITEKSPSFLHPQLHGKV